MIVSPPVVVAVSSAANVARVGPIVVGESMADVQRLLGAGSVASSSAVERVYGDGTNVLKVTFGGADRRVISVEIDLEKRQDHVPPARVPPGAFARWTWEGRRIDRLPTTKVLGWSGPVEPVEKDCFVSFDGATRATGAKLFASYQCASGTARVAEFSVGLADP